jgi:hypothetical protein
MATITTDPAPPTGKGRPSDPAALSRGGTVDLVAEDDRDEQHLRHQCGGGTDRA